MYTPNIITVNESKFAISNHPSELDIKRYVYTLTKYNTKYLVKLCQNSECPERNLPNNQLMKELCKYNGIKTIPACKK